MQLSRARFLLSAFTTYQGLSLVSVWANILSPGVIHPVPSRLNVHGAELPALDGIAHALLESLFLLLIVHREPMSE